LFLKKLKEIFISSVNHPTLNNAKKLQQSLSNGFTGLFGVEAILQHIERQDYCGHDTTST